MAIKVNLNLSSGIEKDVEVNIAIEKSELFANFHLNTPEISENDGLNPDELPFERDPKKAPKRVLLLVEEGSDKDNCKDGINIRASDDFIIEIKEHPGF